MADFKKLPNIFNVKSQFHLTCPKQQMKSPQFVPDCVNEKERKPHGKLNLKSSKNGYPRSNWNLWKLELTEIVWNGIELSVRPVPERGLPSRSHRG